MRHTLRTLLLLALFLTAGHSVAAAQSQSTVETLTLSLLPQYDDPRLLIIYEATLSAPGEVAFAVPPSVELHHAAYRAEDGTLHEVEGHFDAASNGRFVRFTVATREARLELYQDVIPRQTERFIDFTLPAHPYDIPLLRWVAIFPLNASAIATTPAMTSTGQSHLGLQSFEREAGPLPAGTRAEQSIEWQRESSEPAIFVPQAEAADGRGGFQTRP
ncbi:MAG: hypothetical protein H0T73_07710, partial [Ardenticatenales bacterium]|nr:hypothetical protein [Ardenticatenales bacterium]